MSYLRKSHFHHMSCKLKSRNARHFAICIGLSAHNDPIKIKIASWLRYRRVLFQNFSLYYFGLVPYNLLKHRVGFSSYDLETQFGRTLNIGSNSKVDGVPLRLIWLHQKATSLETTSEQLIRLKRSLWHANLWKVKGLQKEERKGFLIIGTLIVGK